MNEIIKLLTEKVEEIKKREWYGENDADGQYLEGQADGIVIAIDIIADYLKCGTQKET
jgi:hypothetical protein